MQVELVAQLAFVTNRTGILAAIRRRSVRYHNVFQVVHFLNDHFFLSILKE